MGAGHRAALAILAALVLLGNGPATVLVRHSLPELVRMSPIIVTGTVELRDATPVLAVEEMHKGRAPSEVTIEILQVSSWIAPEFQDGERVLLFLEPGEQPDALALVGPGDQGK